MCGPQFYEQDVPGMLLTWLKDFTLEQKRVDISGELASWKVW